jgi:FtsP/CotA-like multicopper oxidase with cupredoxin domain
MGGLREGILAGERLGIRELARRGLVWAFNGVVAEDHTVAPWLRLDVGTSHVLEVENRTAFPHPLHLHGHPVRIVSRDGVASPYPVWRDSVLVWPRERVELAFVADNPGRWMIHCHIPEHQEAGMMGVVEVG